MWSAGAGRLQWTRLVQSYSLSCALNQVVRHPSEYSAAIFFPPSPSLSWHTKFRWVCFSRNRHLVRPFFMQRGGAVLRAWAQPATVDSRCFVGVVTAKPLHFPATTSTCYPFLFFSSWLLEGASGRREGSETEFAQNRAASWQVCPQKAALLSRTQVGEGQVCRSVCGEVLLKCYRRRAVLLRTEGQKKKLGTSGFSPNPVHGVSLSECPTLLYPPCHSATCIR